MIKDPTTTTTTTTQEHTDTGHSVDGGAGHAAPVIMGPEVSASALQAPGEREKGLGKTLPEPLDPGDFVKRLEEALEEEKGKTKSDKLVLARFREVVLGTAKAAKAAKDVAAAKAAKFWDLVKAWVLAVWVR